MMKKKTYLYNTGVEKQKERYRGNSFDRISRIASIGSNHNYNNIYNNNRIIFCIWHFCGPNASAGEAVA